MSTGPSAPRPQAIEDGMRNVLRVITAIALLPAPSAAVEQRLPKKSETPIAAGRHVPLKGAGNPCAVYGAGFIRVDGTQTCIKIGGAVSIETGGSR